MTAKKKPKKHIRAVFNLLKPQVAPPTAWDTVYDWLATRARFIMIFSQVLIAQSS